MATVDHKSEETENETGVRVNRLIDLYRRRDTLTEDDLNPDCSPPSYDVTDTWNISGMERDKLGPLSGDVVDVGFKNGGSVRSSKRSLEVEDSLAAKRSVAFEGEIDAGIVEANMEGILSEKEKDNTCLAKKQSDASMLSYVNTGFEPDTVTQSPDASNWQLKVPIKFDLWSEHRKVFRDPSLVVGGNKHGTEKKSSGNKGYPVAVDMVPDSVDYLSSTVNPIRKDRNNRSGLFLQFWVLIR